MVSDTHELQQADSNQAVTAIHAGQQKVPCNCVESKDILFRMPPSVRSRRGVDMAGCLRPFIDDMLLGFLIVQ